MSKMMLFLCPVESEKKKRGRERKKREEVEKQKPKGIPGENLQWKQERSWSMLSLPRSYWVEVGILVTSTCNSYHEEVPPKKRASAQHGCYAPQRCSVFTSAGLYQPARASLKGYTSLPISTVSAVPLICFLLSWGEKVGFSLVAL